MKSGRLLIEPAARIGRATLFKSVTFAESYRVFPRSHTYTARRQKVTAAYPNPFKKTCEWHRIMETEGLTVVDLASRLGVSIGRVSQVLSLLRLDPAVIRVITDMGEWMPCRLTENRLRSLLDISNEEQRHWLEQYLSVLNL